MKLGRRTFARWAAIGGIALLVQALVALSTMLVVSRPPSVATTPVAKASSTPSSTPSTLPAAPPSPRSWAASAFFPPSKELILFGGMTAYSPGQNRSSNETWAWDGGAWRQLHPVNNPPARFAAGMVYDPVAGVLVLYGGTPEGQTGFTDTWTWDGVNWKQMSPSTSPPSWPVVTMTYDTVRKAALIYLGGLLCPCAAPNETWSWNGTTWSQVATATTPDLRNGQQMSGIVGMLAFDSTSRQTLYVGETGTWVLTSTGWMHVSDGGTQARSDQFGSAKFALTNDGALGGVLEIGANSDTWAWDGTAWTAQNPAVAPPARYGETLAYDPVHNLVILFGGAVLNPPQWNGMNDLWAWDGKAWKQLA